MSKAVLSPCLQFRYLILRQWGPQPLWTGRLAGFLMCNPSDADAEKDDPTIRRDICYAKDLGYDGFIGFNLFGFRSPKPKALTTAADPVGPENDRYIAWACERVEIVICAWGAILADTYEHQQRVKQVMAIVRRFHPTVYSLGLSKRGHPRHPLMLKKTCTPTIFTN